MRLRRSLETSSHHNRPETRKRCDDADGATWWSRVSKGVCLALIASPASAGARPLASAAFPGLPALGGARSLLSCQVGPWGPPSKGSWGPDAAGLVTPSVRGVTTNSVWVQTRSAPCAPNHVETQVAHELTYTFNSTRFPLRRSGNLGPDASAKVVSDFRYISSLFNLRFTEYNEIDTGPEASLTFFDFLDAFPGEAPWVASGPGEYSGNVSAMVARTNATVAADEQRLGAIGIALGLAGPMGAGLNNDTNRAQRFPANSFSSIAFGNKSACPSMNLGALDLAAMAAKYGLAEAIRGNRSLQLTSRGVRGEGLIFSGASNNSLAVVYNGHVQLSLEDDGIFPSIVGESVYLLAPGSKVAWGDVSRTSGAFAIGNNDTNTLIGGPGTDAFFAGAGITVVTTGGGNDSVAIRYPNSHVTVTDFAAGQSLALGPAFDANPKVVIEASRPGINVRLPQNVTVYLPTVSQFAPGTLLQNGWPFPGLTSGPCVYLAPPPAAPTNTTPRYDYDPSIVPCEVGRPNDMGCLP